MPGELAAVPLRRLEGLFGEADAQWLSRLAQGIDDAAVKPRMLPKSISCSASPCIPLGCAEKMAGGTGLVASADCRWLTDHSAAAAIHLMMLSRGMCPTSPYPIICSVNWGVRADTLGGANMQARPFEGGTLCAVWPRYSDGCSS